MSTPIEWTAVIIAAGKWFGAATGAALLFKFTYKYLNQETNARLTSLEVKQNALMDKVEEHASANGRAIERAEKKLDRLEELLLKYAEKRS